MKFKKTISGVLALATFLMSSLSTFGSASAYSVETKDTPQPSAAAVEYEPTKDPTPIYDYGLCDNIKDGAILHAWCWSFNTIKNNMADIAAAGYTAVQTSPASKCYNNYPNKQLMGSDTTGRDGAWWWQYQPIELTVGNYQLGTRGDYQAMCEEAHKYNVKIITDIVSNHTTAEKDSNGNYAVTQNFIDNVIGEDAAYDVDEIYHVNYDNPRTNKNDRFQMINYKNSDMIDVNTENDKYQDYLVRYINDLITLGCDGFRFDMAANIGGIQYDKDHVTPDRTGEEYDYWDIVTGNKAQNNQCVGKTAASGTNLRKTAGELFYYGEILGNDSYNHLSDYSDYINVTNSQFGYDLRSSIKNNSGLPVNNDKSDFINQWSSHPLRSPDKMVTWVESHDTFLNDHNSSWMTDWKIRACWAVVAARNSGTPLFYNRPDGSDGANNNYWGNNELGAKGNDQFKHPEVAAVNKFRNAMSKAGATEEKLSNINSSSKVLQIDRYKAVGNTEETCGTCIINLKSSNVEIDTYTELADGTDYYDMVSGNSFKVENHKLIGSINAESIAVIYKPSTDIILSANSDSNSFTDTLSVNLKLMNNSTTLTSGSYKVIAEEQEIASGSFANGDILNIDGGSAVTVKDYKPVTLILEAYDKNNNKITRTYTYKKLKSASTGDMYIYFDNTTYHYTNIKVYLYNGSINNGAGGAPMTYDAETGFYKYKVPDTYKNCKWVFFYDQGEYPTSNRQYLNGTSKLFTAENKMIDYAGQFIDTNSEITDYNYIYYFNTTQENNIIATFYNGNITSDVSMQYNSELHCYYCKYDSKSNYSTVQFSNGANNETQFVTINPGKVYVPTSYTRGKWIEPSNIKERKIYFKNSLNWSKVYAHMWNGNGTSFDTWPGLEMTSLGNINDLGNNIYCLTYYYPSTSASDDDYRNLIFNNGDGTQTADLTIPLDNTNKPLIYELGEKDKNDHYLATSSSIDSKLDFDTLNKTVNIKFRYSDHKVAASNDNGETYQEKNYYKTVNVKVENSGIEEAIAKASESVKDCNLYETYTFYTSEFNYIKSIASDTNEDRLGKNMNYASKINPKFFTKSTSAFSGIYSNTIGALADAQNNSEWVKYYNRSTPVDYEKIKPDFSNVTDVEVWLVNTPKKNFVKFYYPTTTPTTLTPLEDNEDNVLFVAPNNTQNTGSVKQVSYGCYYNQILSDTAKDFEDLTSDMVVPTIQGVESSFDGWYFIDFDDKNNVQSYVKVSSEKEYKYRVTSNMNLYAVFTKSKSSKVGAAAIPNDIDQFTDNVNETEVEKYRYNTILNVYNYGDYDETNNLRITDVAVIYVKTDSNSYTLSKTQTINKCSAIINSAVNNNGKVTNADVVINENENTAKCNCYTYSVGSSGTVKLTEKNRLQFILTLTKAQAEDSSPTGYNNVLAFTAYKINNSTQWVISDNCVHYYYVPENVDNKVSAHVESKLVMIP